MNDRSTSASTAKRFVYIEHTHIISIVSIVDQNPPSFADEAASSSDWRHFGIEKVSEGFPERGQCGVEKVAFCSVRSLRCYDDEVLRR